METDQDTVCWDVFLSFRGEVRNSFACVLFQALRDIGHRPFMDKEDVRAGDKLTPKILKAIKNCKSAIIVFSKDYASSAWCLDELVLLLERRARTRTFFIVPILHCLRAKDVKQGFCKEIDQNYKNKKYKDDVDDQKIEMWKKAVVEIGDTTAEHFRDSMMVTDFAKGIARRVQELFDEMRALPFSKRTIEDEPLVVKPAPKEPEPFTLLSTILQHNQPVPTTSTGNRSVQLDSVDETNDPIKEAPPLPQVSMPEGKLDQGASSSQLQSLQTQHVPTSLDTRIESTTSAKLVLYTSSGGVRSTVDRCRKAKNILEDQEVEFEERDAWTNDKFTAELKQLVGIPSYPRLFVSEGGHWKELRDNGELGPIVKSHKKRQGNSGQTSSPISEIKEEEKKAGFSFTYRYYSPCIQAERTVCSKSKKQGGYLYL